MHKSITLILVILAISANASAAEAPTWSEARANEWYANQPWLVGSNYITSTAINELEMWQADTFDLATIDREFGWAETLGMNTMRVFLHNLLWQQDSEGFLRRLEQFLQVAEKHHIRILFVLLDSVWDPNPKLGKQREPRPHVHNSGWVQAPGAEILKDESRWNRELRPYVMGVVGHFRDDKRVLMWDLMNEPDNDNPPYKAQELRNKAEVALRLIRQEWTWARDAKPSQPLTSGVWKGDWSSDDKLSEMSSFQLRNSDVITFHSYEPPEVMKGRIQSLRRLGRPLVCTEYMARPRASTFAAILPLLKAEEVGAYNWGFVDGKSQTIYPWDSWERPYVREQPTIWFHEVFKEDDTPYRQQEVDLIRALTGRGTAAAAGAPVQ